MLGGVAAAWASDFVPGRRDWRTAPETASWWRRAGDGLTLACGLVAAAPDADLLFGVHRTFSHSVAAAGTAGVLAAAIAAKMRRPVLRVALMIAAAWLSHIVLDWMAADYVPPYGIQAFWPFSEAWCISGWDLFRQTERRHFFTIAAIRTNTVAVAQEIAILLPIVAIVWFARQRAMRRFQ